MRIDSRDEYVLHRSDRSEIVRVHGNGHESRVLKVVPRSGASADRVGELRREFELTSSLAGKNLVGCFGLECTNDVWAIHFEDIGGQSLDAHLGALAFDREAFFAIAVGLAEALASLHARNVLHLAIEPAHVVFAESTRELRVIDFSNAIGTKSAFADPEHGAPHGPWSAPELRGIARAPVDGRTDLFGLGATLHGLVHGTPPSSTRTHAPHASDYLAPALLELIGALVRTDPSERPSDADTVRRALVALRDGTEVSLRVPPRSREVERAVDAVRANGRGALVFEGDSDDAERAWLVGLEHATSSARLLVVRGDRDRRGREAATRALEHGSAPFVLVVDGPAIAKGPTEELVDRLARTGCSGSYVLLRRRTADELAWLEALSPRMRIAHVRRDDRSAGVDAMSQLSDEARELLALASLASDPVSLRVLSSARAVSAADPARAIAELVSAGLARPSASPHAPRLAPTSEGLRRALRASLPAERQAELHLRLARAYESVESEQDDGRARLLALHLASGRAKIATETERRRRLDALVEGIANAGSVGDVDTSLSLGVTLAASCEAGDTARAGRRLATALLDVTRVALDVGRLDEARVTLDAARGIAREREDVGRAHGLTMRLELAHGHVESAVVELDAALRALASGVVLRTDLASTIAAHRVARNALRTHAPREPATGSDAYALDVLRDALLDERALPRRVARSCASQAVSIALGAGTHPAFPLGLSFLACDLARTRPAAARSLSALAVEEAIGAEGAIARRVGLVHALSFAPDGADARATQLRALAHDAELDRDDETALDALVAAAVVDLDAGRPLPAIARAIDAGASSLPHSPRLALVAQAVDNLRTRDRLAPSELRGPRFEEGDLVEAMSARDPELVTLAFATRSVLASLFDRQDDAVRFRAAHGLARRSDDPVAMALGLSFHATLAAFDVDRSPIELTPLVVELLLDAREAGDVAAPRLVVLAAEIVARTPLEGRAAMLFERAADAAYARGRPLDAARIHERAARYHGRRGERAPYERALRSARDAYRALGYDAKVEELERGYPWLRVSPR